MDAEFAEQVLYPGLEEAGLKVCIHTVHWQLGEAISEQIVGSVTRSRKTLIVLSNNYVNSEWTRMEFMAANSLTRRDNFQVSLWCSWSLWSLWPLTVSQGGTTSRSIVG